MNICEWDVQPHVWVYITIYFHWKFSYHPSSRCAAVMASGMAAGCLVPRWTIFVSVAGSVPTKRRRLGKSWVVMLSQIFSITVTVNKSFTYQAHSNMVLLSNINGSWDYCLHSQWGINDSNWVHMGTSSIFLKACNDFAQLGHCVQHSGTRQMAGCLSFQVNPGFCLPSWHLLLGWLPGSVPCG